MPQVVQVFMDAFAEFQNSDFVCQAERGEVQALEMSGVNRFGENKKVIITRLKGV
jgi:hypothetical protein